MSVQGGLPRLLVAAALTLSACGAPEHGRESERGPDAGHAKRVEHALALDALPGWADENHVAAFAAYKATCGLTPGAALPDACARARAARSLGKAEAKAFFEASFHAAPSPAEGLLTAYFAPGYEARRKAGGAFSAPVRPRPADLKIVDAALFDPPRAGQPGVARDKGGGRLEPYPDRAGIEARPAPDALAWMRPEELFFLQLQGSGVLTFEDGRRKKALYAANNGRPFVGLAKPMRERGLLAADKQSGEAIRAWLAAHRGPEATAIMRLNPSYAFFRLTDDDGHEPVGTGTVPLPPGRAVAVDPAFHPMGELLWISAESPAAAGALPPYRRLVTALDTGKAIKGEGRADLYLGSGPGAGAEAGRVRHQLRMFRVVPKAAAPAS